MAHLMKFHLLQWEVIKIKFLINSNMTLTVLNLHQKTDPKLQQDFKGQGSLRQAQRLNQDHTMMLHTYNPNQCPYQASTSYTLQFPRYSPDKIFKLKVTMARSKVKSRSDHDVAHLQPLTNVPIMYQLPNQYAYKVPTSYTLQFPRYSPDKIL